MSFFAVLKPNGEATSLSVEECHLNLWSLGALGPRRTTVLDVGLRLHANDGAIESIRLALPFGTRNVIDLASKFLNIETAELIFDTEVTRPTPDSIQYRDQNLKIFHIALQRAEREENYASQSFSVWQLPLAQAIPRGETGYVRVRFDVTGTGRTWQWQRTWLLRTGAIIDFRLCDIRSTTVVPGGEELRHAILPINKLAAFVMVPAWLYARASSPATTYVRLLEGSVWANYLDRAPELHRGAKLVVYSWRNYHATTTSRGEAGTSAIPPTSAHISISQPLRIFLHLAKESGPVSPFRVLFYALTTIVIVAAIFDVKIRPPLPRAAREAWEFTSGLPTWLQLTSAAGIITFVLAKRISAIGQVASWIKNKFLHLEQTLYRKLPK